MRREMNDPDLAASIPYYPGYEPLWVGGGMARAQVFPKDTSGTDESLRKFGAAVTRVVPDATGAPFPENSWATGTNPAVNSIYQRLLATHPALANVSGLALPYITVGVRATLA